MGGIYMANPVGTAVADRADRILSVAEMTADQFNAALVDEDGTEIAIVAATGLDFTGVSPVSHPINLEGLTLPASSNVIRGANINPTRTSGWTSFSGTVETTPNPVYMDYRELHSTGAAEVLGVGLFPFMDSGASGKSMYALQAIAEADAGATVAAATGVGDGVFPIWAKCLINSAGFNASAVAAAAFLSFQANDTDVSAADTSILNMEIASGGIRSVFKVQDSAAGGATYLFDFTDDLGKPCSLTNGTVLADIKNESNEGWIRVRIGSTVRYIPLYAENPS
jgi:hypothetical protein